MSLLKRVTFLFVVMLFSLANAENYTIDLYDNNSSATKGFWHVIGIGTLSEPPIIPAPPSTGNTVIPNVAEGSEQDGIHVPDRDYLDDESKMKDIVTLENISGSEIKSVSIWIDKETYKPLKYFSGDPLDTMFIRLEDSTVAKSQFKIKFKEPLNGATLFIQYKKADDSDSGRYSVTFTHKSSINEPTIAKLISLSDNGLTLDALQKVKPIKNIVVDKNGDSLIASELRVYKYDGEWHYYSNKNSEAQNDFTDFEGGYAYWMKLDGNPAEGSDIVGKIQLNDGYFKLDSKNIDTYTEYYKTMLHNGWNLISLPSSKIRNSVTGLIVKLEKGNDETKIEVNVDGQIKDFNITKDEDINITQEFNTYIKDFNLRAFLLEDSKMLLISNKEFSITEVENGGTGKTLEVTTLFGENVSSDLNTTAVNSKIEGVGLLFKQNTNSQFNATNFQELTINKKVVGYQDINDSNVTELDFMIDSNFDGSFDDKDAVAVLSKNEFSVKENILQRAYELDLKILDENWTDDGDDSNDINYSIYLQDIELIISNDDKKGEENISKRIVDIINSKTGLTNVMAYKIDPVANDKKVDLYLALKKDIKKPLRAYDNSLNPSMLLKPKNGFFSNVNGIYPLYQIVDSAVDSVGILSLPTSIPSPATTEITTDLKPIVNSLAIINRAGYNIGKILTAHVNTKNGNIDWDYVSFNVPDDKWFNNPDQQMDLMNFDKKKGYWFYLKEKDSDSEQAPFRIVDEPSINLAFEHYYDNNNSIVYNVFATSITLQVEYDDTVTQNRVQGYVKIADKKFNLKKSVAGDVFSVDIKGYYIGELSNLKSIDIYLGDGRGNFELKNIPLNRIKPETPSKLAIADFDSTDATVNIVDSTKTETENSTSKNSDSNIKKYFIYKTFINSSDNEDIPHLSVDKDDKDDTTEVNVIDIFKSFKDIKLEDGQISISVVALDNSELGFSYLSDIAKFEITPLHCQSYKVTSSDGVASKVPTKFDENCKESDEVIADGGVVLKSLKNEIKIYFSPITNTTISNSEVPEVMFIGLDDEAIAKISFNHAYLKTKFYISYDGKLYKGEFSKEHENGEIGTFYILKGGVGDKTSGKEIY